MWHNVLSINPPHSFPNHISATPTDFNLRCMNCTKVRLALAETSRFQKRNVQFLATLGSATSIERICFSNDNCGVFIQLVLVRLCGWYDYEQNCCSVYSLVVVVLLRSSVRASAVLVLASVILMQASVVLAHVPVVLEPLVCGCRRHPGSRLCLLVLYEEAVPSHHVMVLVLVLVLVVVLELPHHQRTLLAATHQLVVLGCGAGWGRAAAPAAAAVVQALCCGNPPLALAARSLRLWLSQGPLAAEC